MDHSTSDAAGPQGLDYNLILDPVGSLINANQGGWHRERQRVCPVVIAWEFGFIAGSGLIGPISFSLRYLFEQSVGGQSACTVRLTGEIEQMGPLSACRTNHDRTGSMDPKRKSSFCR